MVKRGRGCRGQGGDGTRAGGWMGQWAEQRRLRVEEVLGVEVEEKQGMKGLRGGRKA